MANEATLVYELESPLPFTVANATGVERGSLMKLTDPRTAIITSAANDTFAGVLASEKIASDGKTTASVYRRGIFKMTLSGSCTVGDALVTDSAVNHVKKCPDYTTLSSANLVGIALETGTTGETILVELNPQTIQYA